MSNCSKLDQQDAVVEAALAEMNPVEESWKLGLARILGFIGVGNAASYVSGKALGLTSIDSLANMFSSEDGYKSFMARLTAVNVAGLASAFGTAKLIKIQASKELQKLFDNDKMKAYLKKECDAIFKEVKKENSRITPNVEEYKSSKAFKKLATKDRSFIANHLTQIAQCSIDVAGYTIVGTGDTDSFDQLYVVFYNPDDTKLIKKAIPIPGKEDIGAGEEERKD